SFLADDLLEQGLELLSLPGVGRQKDHADTVAAGLGERDAHTLAFFLKEAMRDLQQDAGAVSSVLLTAARPAVLQAQQDLDRLADDVVRTPGLEIDDKAHAARIVFVAWIVQALGRRESCGHVSVLVLRVRRWPCDALPSVSCRGAWLLVPRSPL